MKTLLIFYVICLKISFSYEKIPLVINTWNFENAATEAWNTLQNGGSAIDALVSGCSRCERDQCDGTVGFGGSPNEMGETTLDALIMDGMSMKVGAVAAMEEIKDAISVAKYVLQNTKHSLLVGRRATDFAVEMGFKRESLSTESSKNKWNIWKNNNCQPNFWINVVPNSKESCGPYEPISNNNINNKYSLNFGWGNHDTIGMIVIDSNRNIVAGTSTNGAAFKIPGRVGDSPIAGSGAYAEGKYGAAVATGDGDILMRFLPSFLAVERLRNGDTPEKAAKYALQRIIEYYPIFMGALVVADINGNYSAACHGIPTFPYSVHNMKTKKTIIEEIVCLG